MRGRVYTLSVGGAVEGIRMMSNPLNYIGEKITEMADAAIVSKKTRERKKLGREIRFELTMFFMENLRDIKRGVYDLVETESSLPRKALLLGQRFGVTIHPEQLHYGLRGLCHVAKERPELMDPLEEQLGKILLQK